eukprot:COSAG02_NODE_3628_length_6450_cov_12.534876_2_plen_106_part_00
MVSSKLVPTLPVTCLQMCLRVARSSCVRGAPFVPPSGFSRAAGRLGGHLHASKMVWRSQNHMRAHAFTPGSYSTYMYSYSYRTRVPRVIPRISSMRQSRVLRSRA